MDSQTKTIRDLHGSEIEVWESLGGLVLSDITDPEYRTTLLILNATETRALHRLISRLVLPAVTMEQRECGCECPTCGETCSACEWRRRSREQ